MPSPDWLHEQNSLIRISGNDPSVYEVLAAACAQNLPVVLGASRADAQDDYAQIDPELSFAAPTGAQRIEKPDARLGYAAYSPQQRFQFLNWLDNPLRPGPTAFQSLYLAMLEVRLFEKTRLAEAAHLELLRLHMQDAWREHAGLARTILLAFWLQRDGASLSNWLDQGALPADLLGVALGMLGLLETELTAAQAVALMAVKSAGRDEPDREILVRRLTSLPAALGEDPLPYCLNQLDSSALQPAPYHTTNRDIHVKLPQPDIGPLLAPILLDMSRAESEPATEGAPNDAPTHTPQHAGDREWFLVLEFGHSRSEYFDFALHLAQRNDSFVQIMDENRKLVYRVFYRKGRLRDFWRLWDYVQGWSTSRVYINGEEMEKWKIWPYSQYLR